MFEMANTAGKSREEVVNEQRLWHGTSGTNPKTICMGQDGVDFRRVRHDCFWWLSLVVAHMSVCRGRQRQSSRRVAKRNLVVVM